MKNTLAEQMVMTVGDQMVKIPSGKILLRDDKKKISWTVELKPYLIAKYPVTQEIYLALTQTNPFSFHGAKKPVESVSWFNAVTFCNQLSQQAGLRQCYTINNEGADLDDTADGYRLPTEAEWEYACRAGTQEARYGELDEIAWYENNAEQSTQDVGTKKPNSWGLYDMLGNVWEWCGDLYDVQIYGSYRVFRGGGWSDSPRGCLASNRRKSHPTYQIDDLGFRLARSLRN